MKVSKKKEKLCLTSAEDRAVRAKLYIILSLVGVVIYSLYCFAIMPIYNGLAVDFEIGLVEPVVFELAILGVKLVDVLAVSLTGSIVIYAVYRLSASKTVGACLIFAGLGLYKYTASTVYEWIESNYIPSDFLLQIIFAIAEALIWTLPFVAAFFAVNAIIKGFKKSENVVDKNGDLVCLLVSVAVLSLTVLVLNVGGQLIYDIFTLVSIEDPWLMLWDYFSHALLAVIGYSCSVLLVFILCKCFGGEETRRIC